VQTSLSTDGGNTWAHETLPDLAVRANTAIFDPSNPSRILIGGDLNYSSSFLRVSTDLGASWNAGEDGLSGAVNVIVPVPSEPGTFYCGTTQGCFQSTDGGLTWNQKGSITAVQALVVDTINTNIIYAGTQSGVYCSTDGGDDWNQYGSVLPVHNVMSLALVSGTSGALLAGTNGASAFTIAPIAGVAEQPGGKPAARAGQLNVSPNPTRGPVLIKLDHLSAGVLEHCGVSIFDASGRLVRVLSVPQSLTSGTGSLSWDGRDRQGRLVPAGAYFCRLQAGDLRAAAALLKL
jgi:hypothetical protein